MSPGGPRSHGTASRARYICIHGHFYQPPRENPWLQTVEIQDSAYPHHDWNERITAECYAPNADSRILDEQDRIVRIVNNYARISFNFGPTLLSWLERHAPETYRAILEADRESAARFSGHGSALAQVYSHPILPLCNARDRRTQVLWGIRDFAWRFGREPEGMWLPETAVDTASLEELAAHGIRFTVLSPGQARRVRAPGERGSRDVSGGRIDTTVPYLVDLPSGRSIAVFFYDAAIAHGVAFARLLSRGDRFVERLIAGFPEAGRGAALVHIATDGETYGHHHRFGEMALSWALGHLESGDLARVTNYGEFLERHPPTARVEIAENTAWSCAHGLGRWRENCGCRGGGQAEWTQAWRGPLRDALDWLRDTVAPHFEARAEGLLADAWQARDRYVSVVLDRSPSSIEEFLGRHARAGLDPTERVRALKLLELQRQMLLMYTSCGWFFDEISGIETVQILRYAARGVELAEELFGLPLEAELLSRLALAPSNLSRHPSGREVYEQRVRPAAFPPSRVAANHVAALLFDDDDRRDPAPGFEVRYRGKTSREAGRARLIQGRLELTALTTLERDTFDFALLHLGDHNLYIGIRAETETAAFETTRSVLEAAFDRGDLSETRRLVEERFSGSTHALEALPHDERRRILARVLDATLGAAEAAYRRLYDQHAPLLRFIASMDIPAPPAFEAAAEVVLNADIRGVLQAEPLDTTRLGELLEQAARGGVVLDRAGLGYAATAALDQMSTRLLDRADDLDLASRLADAIALLRGRALDLDLRRVENRCYRLLRTTARDPGDAARLALLARLGDVLRFAGSGTGGAA